MKVSVCIPTFNQAKYLKKAVLSAANQTLQPYEIIVSDDSSTDETAAVLESLSREIFYLRVVRQPKNLGIAKNTDVCLRHASGEFIVRLDSDDYLAPQYLNELARLLKENPEAGYAHAAVQEVDQYDNPTRERKLRRKAGYQPGVVALKAAITGYRVAANIIMFRRSALERVGFITGRPNYVEDFHLSASLAGAGFGNVYSDKLLSFYRIWIDSNQVRQKRKLMEISGLHRVFEEVLEPVYRENGWGLSELKRRRTSFACRQADCLGWSVYTAEEKWELIQALTKLSPSMRVKFYIWIFTKGYGRPFQMIRNSSLYLRTTIKSFILR